MKLDKVCIECGNVFKVKESKFHLRKTCSRSCMAKLYKRTLRGKSNPNYKGAGEKVCKQCGKDFNAEVKSRIYCSKICYFKFRLANKKPAKIKPVKIKATPKPLKPVTYCECGTRTYSERVICVKCENKASHPSKICRKCGVKFKVNKQQRFKKYCSRDCRRKDFNGASNPNYRGGVKSENKKIRDSREYAEWRTKVFQRDNYTCQHCGQIGGTLNADHIKPFAIYPELRLDINNGRTLCVPCHRKTPTFLSSSAYWQAWREQRSYGK